MSDGFFPNSAQIAESRFKPLDGGYLFETPNPWIFAPGRRYVVTAAQKAELVGIMTPRRLGLRVAVASAVAIAFGCGLGALWWKIAGHENPTALDQLGMAITALISLYLLAVVLIRHHLGRIAPILATATPTAAKFTAGERRQAINQATPTKALVLGVVAWGGSAIIGVVTLAIRGGMHGTAGHPISYTTIFHVVVASSIALTTLYTLLKRRAGNSGR
jgi:hypothetical protein